MPVLLGIDFIIYDHHLPGEELQKLFAVLDRKEPIVDILTKNFRVVEWAFKLCQGLNTIYKIPENELYELTDLLAISIAADIVANDWRK